MTQPYVLVRILLCYVSTELTFSQGCTKLHVTKLHYAYHSKTKDSILLMKFIRFVFWISLITLLGHAVAKLLEALCYKPEGRGFESR
jgi:hypothetical protein